MIDGPSLALQRFIPGTPSFEDALLVYGRAWPEDDPTESRSAFLEYALYRDFVGLVAYVGDLPAGVGYGARSYSGIWWHDEVIARLGADHPAMQDAWRLVELAVVPELQGQCIGSAIHDALLASVPEYHRLLIATTVSNQRARGIYERRGWRTIATLHLPGKSEAHQIFTIER